MVHGSLCPQLSFQVNQLWFGFILSRKRNIDETGTNPVPAVRAICVLFKMFASPQLCTKMQVWMYYLDVFFSSRLFGVFFLCILYCFYDFLCSLFVQMHQSVSVDE